MRNSKEHFLLRRAAAASRREGTTPHAARVLRNYPHARLQRATSRPLLALRRGGRGRRARRWLGQLARARQGGAAPEPSKRRRRGQRGSQAKRCSSKRGQGPGSRSAARRAAALPRRRSRPRLAARPLQAARERALEASQQSAVALATWGARPRRGGLGAGKARALAAAELGARGARGGWPRERGEPRGRRPPPPLERGREGLGVALSQKSCALAWRQKWAGCRPRAGWRARGRGPGAREPLLGELARASGAASPWRLARSAKPGRASRRAAAPPPRGGAAAREREAAGACAAWPAAGARALPLPLQGPPARGKRLGRLRALAPPPGPGGAASAAPAERALAGAPAGEPPCSPLAAGARAAL